MRTGLTMFALAAAWLTCHGAGAADAPATGAGRNAFYPQYCFGFGADDPKYAQPPEQMQLLRELGYDGYAHYRVDGLAEVLQAVDAQHLRLFQFYILVSLDSAKPKYDPRLPEALALLKGRETVVSLLIEDKPPLTQEQRQRRIDVVREIADLAADVQLRVAIYPYYTTIADAVELARQSERRNVGVIFSEVFFFLGEEEKNLAEALKTAMPYLYAVNINGIDRDYKGEDLTRYLQTLDRGSFDNLRLLGLLRELGYAGPVGLHCCYVHGDVRDNLTRSLAAWRRLLERLHGTSANQGDRSTPGTGAWPRQE